MGLMTYLFLTKEIRSIRQQLRSGTIDESTYTAAIKEHIRHGGQEQEALDLDVLVHSEPEPSDMVGLRPGTGQKPGHPCTTWSKPAQILRQHYAGAC